MINIVMDRNKQGVAGVIIRNNNRVLMCQRSMESTLPGMWSVPGGHIEKDENAISAAVREFFEETNIKLAPEVLQFVGAVPVENNPDKPFYIYLYDTDEDLIPDLQGASGGFEHSRCRYVKKDDIPTTTASMEKILTKLLLK